MESRGRREGVEEEERVEVEGEKVEEERVEVEGRGGREGGGKR